MKKIISLLMAFAIVFSLCGLVACEKANTDGDGTSGPSDSGTNAPTSETTGSPSTDAPTGETTEETTEDGSGEDEPNSFPYEVEDESMMPLSIKNKDYPGAPTADAQYFIIDPANVIHDGKGTYNNATNTIGTAAFDRNATTYYDCDENCNYVNGADVDYGMIPEDWNCATQAEAIEAGNSGYVGAYFESGIKLIQIRYLPRAGDTFVKRLTGSVFQASVDGTEWVDIGTVELGDAIDGYFSDINVPEEYADIVFKYVRMVGKPHDFLDDPDKTSDWSYCNIAEIEIWGTPAA